MECFLGNILADILLLLLLALSEWMGRNKNIKENSIHEWIPFFYKYVLGIKLKLEKLNGSLQSF
jgi:hypothetical protein